LIASLLARSWQSSAVATPSLTTVQLDEIVPMLLVSGAAGLGWRRIRQTELSTTDSGQLLRQAFRLQALNVTLHERQITTVFKTLRQAGLEPLLAKGWAAAKLYPDSALRPYGDIDLLIRPAELKRARAILSGEATRDCWVDLHTNFSELEGRSIEELFRRSKLETLNQEEIRVLSAEDQLALLCIHLLKHGAWRPLWLCDIAAAIESISAEFDWQICFGADSTRRDWISLAILLAGNLLEANLERASIVSATRLPNWVKKSVLKQWSGLFPANHLPVRPPPLMIENLKSGDIVSAARKRWPDPITATFKLNGHFGSLPRLPYQLGEFGFRAGRFVARMPGILSDKPEGKGSV
jgi:hypothetical protein